MPKSALILVNLVLIVPCACSVSCNSGPLLPLKVNLERCGSEYFKAGFKIILQVKQRSNFLSKIFLCHFKVNSSHSGTSETVITWKVNSLTYAVGTL